MPNTLIRFGGHMAACLFAGTSAIAHAQQVEDIIVTAQKREENLQTVPISISAVTGETARAAGILSTDDLGVVAPGLNLMRTIYQPVIFLRGVGNYSGAPGEEGSNAIYVDGVYYANLPAASFSFNNIERIEVLKGPQGTLFGRNATGGLIQIITKDPGFTPSAAVSAGYGNYDTTELNLYATTGLSEQIATDISVYYINQADGWGTNLFNGRDVGKLKELSLRNKWLIEPSDNTKITLSVDYDRTHSSIGVGRQPLRGAVMATPSRQTYTGDFYDVRESLQPDTLTRQWGGSLRIEQDFGSVRGVSISAYRHSNTRTDFDQDASPDVFADNFFAPLKVGAFTQEVQLLSAGGGPIDWIIGAFYLDSTTRLDPLMITGLAGGPTGITNRFVAMKTRAYAGFAQATAALGDRTNLTLGFRYSKDEREIDATYNNTLVQTLAFSGRKSWSKPTWRVALDHKLGEEVMAFAVYSRGFKSGIFNTINPTQAPVNPETIDAYELGIKSTLFDRRLRLNASGYYYDYRDLQLQRLVGPVSFTFNAAQAEIYGVDADADFAATDMLRLRAGISWIHGRFTSFPDAPFTVRSPVAGNIQTAGDAKGNRLPRAPDLTLNAGIDYTIPIGDNSLQFGATYYYNDGFAWEVDNRIRQGSYSLVNGQIAWAAADDKYRVRLWAKNLFKAKYYTQVTENTLGDNGAVGAPRTFGITFEAKFK